MKISENLVYVIAILGVVMVACFGIYDLHHNHNSSPPHNNGIVGLQKCLNIHQEER